MKNIKSLKIFIIFFFINFLNAQLVPMRVEKDTYFGIEITDDFRNIENLKDTTVLNWIKFEKNKISKILENVKGREAFKNNIIKNYDSRKYRFKNIIHTNNGNVFYVKYSTEDYLDKIYFKNNTINNEELVFDVSKISPNHSISYMKMNNQNTFLAFAITEEGKELSEIYLYDIKKHKILDKVIDHNWVSAIGGIQWLENGEGFYYTRLQNKDITTKDYLLNNKVVLYNLIDSTHKFKEIFSQSSDKLSNLKKSDLFILKKISDNHVFCEINGVNKHKSVYFSKKNKNQSNNFSWEKFYSESDLITNFEINENDIYYLSDLNNLNVISKTTFDKLEFKNKNVIVRAPKDETITKIVFAGKNKYFTTIKNGVQAFLYKFDNKSYSKIELPFDAGSFYEIYPKTANSQDLIIDFSGWTKNYIRYIYKSKENIFVEENIEEKQIL
jgi:prolyl oligopeptidase